MTASPLSDQASPALEPGSTRRGSGAHVAALDGLRALAVAAVIVFHAFPSVAPGGFAGVDVFFVLSGFFITAGLLRDRHLRGFWSRRARRLLPALVLLILVTGSLVHVVGGDAGVGFGGQLVSAVFFFTNWHLIAAGNSYFSQSSPPVFQHLWSLAVEEQFYLVWPVALLTLAHFATRLRTRLAVVVGLAGASLIAAIVLAAIGHIGRAYYGSDSHAFGLLAGAALALVYDVRPRLPLAGRGLGVASIAAIAGLVIAVRTLDGDDVSTYAVWLPIVVLLTLVLIDAAARDVRLLDRTLGARPLVWVGQRSYGLYLWHWPMLILLRNAFPTYEIDHPTTLAVIAIALTVVIASASYAFVERPIQTRGVRGWLAPLARWVGQGGEHERYRFAAVTAGGALLALAVALTASASITAPREGLEQTQIEAGIHAIQLAAQHASRHRHETHGAKHTSRSRAGAPAPHARRRGTAQSRRLGGSGSAVPTGRDITAIGDSVMLASAQGLLHRFPGILINAVVSRQASTAPAILTQMKRHGQLRPIVLIGLGTNGYLPAGLLDAVRHVVGPRRELVLVNTFMARTWEGAVNAQLAAFAARDPRTILVDWHDAIRSHLGLLGPDHIHPGPAGGDFYAATVAAALQRLRPETTTRHQHTGHTRHAAPIKPPAHIAGRLLVRLPPRRPASTRPAGRRTHAGSGSRAGARRAAARGRGSARKGS